MFDAHFSTTKNPLSLWLLVPLLQPLPRLFGKRSLDAPTFGRGGTNAKARALLTDYGVCHPVDIAFVAAMDARVNEMMMLGALVSVFLWVVGEMVPKI